MRDLFQPDPQPLAPPMFRRREAEHPQQFLKLEQKAHIAFRPRFPSGIRAEDSRPSHLILRHRSPRAHESNSLILQTPYFSRSSDPRARKIRSISSWRFIAHPRGTEIARANSGNNESSARHAGETD